MSNSSVKAQNLLIERIRLPEWVLRLFWVTVKTAPKTEPVIEVKEYPYILDQYGRVMFADPGHGTC